MYPYKLSTTGSIDFHNQTAKTNQGSDLDIHALSARRAQMRQALKDCKHKAQDWSALVAAIDNYLPYLHALEDALASDGIIFTVDPVFSWRPTLSSAINPSRIPFHAISAEIIFTHLSHAQAQSNIAGSLVDSLGSYEHQAHLSEVERRAMDERLNSAVVTLCTAAGEFNYLAQRNPDPNSGPKSPPDLSKDVLAALAKMTLADAQLLAIRKLLSKSTNDAAMTPGPPLPKSHPSPILIAKLYIEASTLYGTARGLVTTSTSLKLKRDESQVTPALRQHLGQMQNLTSVLAHQWLGVDAGEQGNTGEAVGFLSWAHEEIQQYEGDNKKFIKRQLEAFLTGYQKENDSIHFQLVLTRDELRVKMPLGRAAVSMKAYQVPKIVYGDVVDELGARATETNERYF